MKFCLREKLYNKGWDKMEAKIKGKKGYNE